MATVAKQQDTVIFTALAIDDAGDPVDLSVGWSGRFVVQRRGDGAPIIDIDETDADLEFNADGTTGKIRATIQTGNTEVLGTYVCQIQTINDLTTLTRSIIETLTIKDTPAQGGLNG